MDNMALSAFDRKARHQLKLDSLLRVAADCFNRKGYSGTSLKDVARRLDLTDAALYYYVKNKGELVYLCYMRAADVGRAALERGIADGSNGYERAHAYLRHHVEAMCGDIGPIAIMSEIPSLSDEHEAIILKRSREHGREFEGILESGIKDGSIAPLNVRMTGNAIMGSINWIPKWFHGDPELAARIIEEFPGILMRGLANPADEADSAS
jgi:AcrR family transcriptional regulator